MGVRSWGERKLVGIALQRAEKEFPVIKRFWRWLTDPNAQGRKRGLTAGLAILSGALRGIGAGIAKACGIGALVGAACTANVGGYAEWADLVGVAVTQFVTPTADLATVAMGIWALIDARRKSKAAAELVSLPR